MRSSCLDIIFCLIWAREYFSGDHSQLAWIRPQRTMRGISASLRTSLRVLARVYLVDGTVTRIRGGGVRWKNRWIRTLGQAERSPSKLRVNILHRYKGLDRGSWIEFSGDWVHSARRCLVFVEECLLRVETGTLQLLEPHWIYFLLRHSKFSRMR